MRRFLILSLVFLGCGAVLAGGCSKPADDPESARVLIIGLDGANYEAVKPLVEAGDTVKAGDIPALQCC